MKTFIISALCVIAALAVLYLIVCRLTVSFAIKKKSKLFMDNLITIKQLNQSIKKTGTHPALEEKCNDYPLEERIRLMQGKMDLDDDHKEYWIKSFDNLDLRAYVYEANEPTGKWIILVHGYGNSAAMMVRMFDAREMRDRGYNILLPDLRAHGSSGGKYVSMGYFDRFTVMGWIKWIIERDPDASIALMGVSMGAATVMLTSGEKLPANVKCIVEDCGYTNAYEQFASVIKSSGIPAGFVLAGANAVAKLCAGYSFKQASPIDAVKKCTLPMMFIHGEKDDFVPTWMVYPLYEACNAEKKLLLVPDAIHARSNRKHPELYWPEVFGFIEKYIGEDIAVAASKGREE